jgi:hypothetical protein
MKTTLSLHPLSVILGLAYWGVLATGCVTMPVDDESPRLRLNLSVEKPASAPSPLKAMMITLASNQGDTLRDTITDRGARIAGAQIVLNPPADHGQVLTPRYTLPRGGASWTCMIESVDARDIVIHQSECDIGALESGEVRDVALRLAARIASYEAVFVPHATTPGGAAIALGRFELDVDGMPQCATALGHATPGAPVTITCDDLPAGPREVVTRVYGRVGDDPQDRLLWSGGTSLEIRAGSGRAVPLPLVWNTSEAASLTTLSKLGDHASQGGAWPQEGLVSMNTELHLGRVGHVVMNVSMPSAVIL